MVYELLILILPFITSPYIARVIGAEGLGKYAYSHSVAYYFVLFSMLGIVNYGNRTIAKKRDNQNELDQAFSELVVVHIIVSIICLLAYFVYVETLEEDKIYAAIQSIFVLSGLFDISWFYFGIEKFKTTVLRSSFVRILSLACIFIFIRSKEDIWAYCLITASCTLLSQLLLWVPLKKYVRFVRPTLSGMMNHIKPLFVLFVPAIAVSLYKYMDKIMIGYLSTKAQLGYYDNAEKMVNMPLTIIVSFGTVMLPKMSNLIASNETSQMNQYLAKSMKYVMCLAIALTFGLAGIGKVFAPVFWGEEFYNSGSLIMGLTITIPFWSFANIIRTQYLIPNNKDKEYLISVIAGAVINLVINWCLIPHFGSVGAMIGTIAAEIAVCLIQSLYVRHNLLLMNYIKSFIPFLPLGGLMFFGVYYIGKSLPTNIQTLLIQIVVGFAIYSSGCVLYFKHTNDSFYNSTVMSLKRKISHKK